jgi:hypothetical protein
MTHHVQRIPVPALELLGADLPETTDHAPVIGLSPALLADYSKHDLDTHDLGVFVLQRAPTATATPAELRRRLWRPSPEPARRSSHDEPLDAQRGFPRSPSQLSQPARVCVPRRAAQASNATACHHHLDW